MTAAYREPKRTQGRNLMQQLIEAVSHGGIAYIAIGRWSRPLPGTPSNQLPPPEPNNVDRRLAPPGFFHDQPNPCPRAAAVNPATNRTVTAHA